MQEERKQIISHALKYNIDNINTYGGYKGDLIVKITTKDKEVMMEIRRYALSLGILEVVVKHNPNIVAFEIYCVTKDEDVYNIKLEDEKEHEKEGEHFEDVWSGTVLN